MKRLIVVACLFLSVVSAAQDEKLSKEDQVELDSKLEMLLSSKIEMEIDEKVFPSNQGNTHFSEDQTAGIIGMVVPQSYAEMKAKMDDDPGKKDMKIVDKGEIVIGGKKVLFMKGEMERDGGQFGMYLYCKENDADSCLMVTSYFEKSKESVYKPHIDKAVASAKVVKQ